MLKQWTSTQCVQLKHWNWRERKKRWYGIWNTETNKKPTKIKKNYGNWNVLTAIRIYLRKLPPFQWCICERCVRILKNCSTKFRIFSFRFGSACIRYSFFNVSLSRSPANTTIISLKYIWTRARTHKHAYVYNIFDEWSGREPKVGSPKQQQQQRPTTTTTTTLFINISER